MFTKMEDNIINSLNNLLIANALSLNRPDGNVNMEVNESLSNDINRNECRSMEISSAVECCMRLPQLAEDSSTDMENGYHSPTEAATKKRKYKRRYESNELEGDGRRQLPARAAKEMKQFSRIEATIKNVNTKGKTPMKFSDIKKIYLNKKLGKFHSTKLETIFEESHSVHNQTNNEQCKPKIGSSKVKRSLPCSTGMNYTKTIIKKRRALIKKVFGTNSKKNKISVEEFLAKLQHFPTEDDTMEDASSSTCCTLTPPL